jgi:hypothetical protein
MIHLEINFPEFDEINLIFDVWRDLYIIVIYIRKFHHDFVKFEIFEL